MKEIGKPVRKIKRELNLTDVKPSKESPDWSIFGWINPQRIEVVT